jgi:flagellar protein FlaJ
MEIKSIPFVPFPLKIALKVSKPFVGLGDKIVKLLPMLETNLAQIESDIRAREYVGIALFVFMFWFLLVFSLFITLGAFFSLSNFLVIGLIVALVISFLSFSYVLMYPKLLVSRKMRNLEKNLLYALRHLTIQVKSGVALFDALVSIAKHDYGVISKEFELCTKKISTGWPATIALEELALRNPSLHFRRAIWQLTNSMRAGTDLGDTLESIVNNLSNEQRIAIRKYGSQLNPLAMMYMMLAVIIPSLGITFLIILSSFVGLPITEVVFLGILAFLTMFQFSFIGIIKSRRPSIEI